MNLRPLAPKASALTELRYIPKDTLVFNDKKKINICFPKITYLVKDTFHTGFMKDDYYIFFLLAVSFANFHGVDEDEEAFLQKQAQLFSAKEALAQARQFVEKDTSTAGDRALEALEKQASSHSQEKLYDFFKKIWDMGMEKGYLTEAEAVFLIKVAQLWKLPTQLLDDLEKYT